MAALRHLPALARVECDAPLGPDALRALRVATAGRLRGLALDCIPRQHCPKACLSELGQLEGLEDLTVAWIAGRTLTHAAPLGALTRLKRLVSGLLLLSVCGLGACASVTVVWALWRFFTIKLAR